MPGGGWIAAGSYHDFENDETETTVELARVLPDGRVEWTHQMANDVYTTLRDMVVARDGTVYVAGSFWDKESTFYGWLMRLGERCVSE